MEEVHRSNHSLCRTFDHAHLLLHVQHRTRIICFLKALTIYKIQNSRCIYLQNTTQFVGRLQMFAFQVLLNTSGLKAKRLLCGDTLISQRFSTRLADSQVLQASVLNHFALSYFNIKYIFKIYAHILKNGFLLNMF